jgi:hypothetical protein
MNQERLTAYKNCAAICREIMRQYKFEDDIAYGARLCLNDIVREIKNCSPDEPVTD